MLTGLKALVAVIAALLGVLGLRWMFAPASAAAEVGIGLGDAVALNTARGDLGGLFIAGALLCGVGLARGNAGFLEAAALVLGCVAVGRVVGVVVDGFSPAALVAIVVELVMLSVLLLTAARMKNV